MAQSPIMAASPQLEDGYTRIANELLDALLLAGLTSRQWAVAMAIVRKTYGFNKKQDDIGLSQLSEMTGIAKTHVGAAVRELAARRVVLRRQGKFGHLLGINKDFSEWIRVTKSVTPSGNESASFGVTESVSRGDRIGSETVTESVTPPVTESVTTKDNPSKDNQKTTPKDLCAPQAERDLVGERADSGRAMTLPNDGSEKNRRADQATGRAMTAMNAVLAERFERFYAKYPKKKSRATAERAFANLSPDEQLLTAMIAGVERAMKSGHWDNPKFIPYPASWLNAAGWKDEVQTAYSDADLVVIQAFNDALGEQLGTVDESIFSEPRAFAIRTFLGLSDKPRLWERFFPWVRDNAELPPHVGFDWLISRDGFMKVKGGQHTKREAA